MSSAASLLLPSPSMEATQCGMDLGGLPHPSDAVALSPQFSHMDFAKLALVRLNHERCKVTDGFQLLTQAVYPQAKPTAASCLDPQEVVRFGTRASGEFSRSPAGTCLNKLRGTWQFAATNNLAAATVLAQLQPKRIPAGGCWR